MENGTLTKRTEASRAKHKFAVKRNSWPKTRGVAMNPVDHVRTTETLQQSGHQLTNLSSLTVVVTTSISVKLRPFLARLPRVKRPVSSLPGELVCSVVLKRPRTRCCVEASGGVGWVFLRSGRIFRQSHQLCSLAEAEQIMQAPSYVQDFFRTLTLEPSYPALFMSSDLFRDLHNRKVQGDRAARHLRM